MRICRAVPITTHTVFLVLTFVLASSAAAEDTAAVGEELPVGEAPPLASPEAEAAHTLRRPYASREARPSEEETEPQRDGDGATTPFAVFGYLPEYRLNGFNYEAAFQTGLTHLIYFSIEVDPQTHLPMALDRLPTAAQAQEARRAADRVGGKVLLGFGGNARSHGFGEMVATAETRLRFLHATNALLEQYNFDGVDYNWEYPRDAREWRLWGVLMQESKRMLRGGNNIVTFTMYQDPNHARVIRQFDLLRHADYVHCMSYDQPGQHSTLQFGKDGIAMGLNDLGGGQKTARQFTLGLPFYARHTRFGEAKTYAELAGEITSRKVDQVGPYYFNSVAMLFKKTRLAMEAGLGGVMIWELGQDVQPLDSPKALMWGINEAITGKTRKELMRSREEKETAKEEL